MLFLTTLRAGIVVWAVSTELVGGIALSKILASVVDVATGKAFSSFPKTLTLISWPRMPFYYVPACILALDKLAVLNLGLSKIKHLFDEPVDQVLYTDMNLAEVFYVILIRRWYPCLLKI